MAVSFSLGIKVELVDPETQNIFFIQKGVPERLGNVWYTPCLSTHMLLQLQLQLTLALISQAQSLLKSITPIFQVFNNSFIPGSFLEYLLDFLCFLQNSERACLTGVSVGSLRMWPRKRKRLVSTVSVHTFSPVFVYSLVLLMTSGHLMFRMS